MIDAHDGHWLAGLIDGEGCFSLTTKRRGPGGKHKRVEFSLKIALRADDQPTLLEVQRLLGGKLCEVRHGLRSAGGGYYGHPLVQWFLNTKAGVANAIAVLRCSPLRSKKRRDFEIWASAFEAYAAYVAAMPRQAGAQGIRIKPASRKRRVLASTPLRQPRRIPEELFTLMEVYASQLRQVRRYVPPTQLSGTTT